jgi:amino acid adenylation domain-containing protein
MNALLQHGITQQARARPEGIAVAHRAACMSYATLEETSNRLAHLLTDAGCRRGDRVALLMPKSPTAIVAILGVLKADAICVPLDPACPPPRLARLIESCDCRCILGAGPVGRVLRDVMAVAALREPPLLGWLDEEALPAADAMPAAFTLRDLSAFPTKAPAYANSDLDLAHIFYTPASTGAPKGVMLTHRNVMHVLRWAQKHFDIAPTDRLSQHAPLHFGLSTLDIFGALWSGAELHLVPPELDLFPNDLARFIRDRMITQWSSMPAGLSLMARYDAVRWGDFPVLRRVMWSGEAPAAAVMHWMQRLPHVQFTGLYGPVETTVASSCYSIRRSPFDVHASIPIGRACGDTELLLLDDQLQPVPAGATGHLYIRGPGLSPGYWRDIAKTRSVFVTMPGSHGACGRMYRTGDLARLAVDGELHLVLRGDAEIQSLGHGGQPGGPAEPERAMTVGRAVAA